MELCIADRFPLCIKRSIIKPYSDCLDKPCINSFQTRSIKTMSILRFLLHTKGIRKTFCFVKLSYYFFRKSQDTELTYQTKKNRSNVIHIYNLENLSSYQ